MARINIEDSIFKDVRFFKLFALCNNDFDKTLGLLVRAWILAQKHYLKTDHRLIPLDEWNQETDFQKLIEVKLSEIKPDGVYVCGSNEQFKWLLQRSDAGKRGVIAKKNKLATVSDRLATADGSKPLTLSLTHSLNTNNNIYTKNSNELNTARSTDLAENAFLLKEKISTSKAKLEHFTKLWNDNCGALPKVSKLTKAREKMLMGAAAKLSESELIQAVRFLASSDFYNGKNASGWKANFDFFFRKDKALELFERSQQNQNKTEIKTGDME